MRTSAYRGTWQPNRRPYVVVAPDCYVSIQGETSVIACGECNRKIDINQYVTGISTEASVDSPPGSATITMSVPDNDVNNFYSDGQFVIIPMMEIEIFAKGYYTVGGFPQYYRIFWGMVGSVTKSWSNGVTTITLNCKDILRWWELTNVNLNPAFLEINKSSSGYNLFANQFAGANPYTIIIALAKDSMGDMSLTTGSFTSHKPESGSEAPAIASYAKDVMAYWQLKFGNIWNSLVLYGTSGEAYTFTGSAATVSPIKLSHDIAVAKQQNQKSAGNPTEENPFLIDPLSIAPFKIDFNKAGDVNFFQSEIQSKLSIAMTARDQSGYEFYCDTTGDIIFKPPFYNLNVLPNKPTSWIQDFEIIDDSVTDSEAEVYTHITGSGNAYGGNTDYGIGDEFTTPRTGVIDYHLLRRYGWRRLDHQLEWAGNPQKLFYHLMDYLDRVNAKRQNGTVTIPMRPELRMGFPIWFPRYDSFFYIQGISHSYSPGGQATTTLTLIAKRSKFIAPKNIGNIAYHGSKTVPVPDPKTGKKTKTTRAQQTYTVTFPSGVGETANLNGSDKSGGPAVIRDPNTGKLLGYPNAVMVYRKTLDNTVLAQLLQASGSTLANKPQAQNANKVMATDATYQRQVADNLVQLQNAQRNEIISRLRMNRYETGMSNAGIYDYAVDEGKVFKEFSVIAADSITWGSGTDGGPDTSIGAVTIDDKAKREAAIKADVTKETSALKPLQSDFNVKNNTLKSAQKAFDKYMANKYKGKSSPTSNQLDIEDQNQNAILDKAKSDQRTSKSNLKEQQTLVAQTKLGLGTLKKLPAAMIMVRPVSDEFGFELIGHYRYGRGSFIDRGKVQLIDPKTSGVANQINIQFAPTGGILTESPRADGLGLNAQTFAQSFEQMQPDDYQTGYKFNSGGYANSFDKVNATGQQTYTDLINQSRADHGQAVFAEADAFKNAKTLGDLHPQLGSGLDGIGFPNCACAIGNTNWLSVLPKTFIQQVLQPISTPSSSGTAAPTDVPEPGGILTADGILFSQPDSSGFFQVLNDFLVQKFNADYQENLKREQFATNGGRAPIDFSTEDAAGGPGSPTSGLLGFPNQALFTRAAQGDPDALAALQSQSNVSFAQANQAMSQFNQQLDSINQKAQNQFSTIGSSIGPSTFVPGSVSTGRPAKFQPPATGPSLSSVLNPKGLPPGGPGTPGTAPSP